ncbi:ABC transporter ATP-binding protein [Fontivita pretiosa]|uniref:ABC transporter ATP-binding protein n=1 Tax=Fontivita pretiosa TaxID=2989684 RepID=UPI003D170ABC
MTSVRLEHITKRFGQTVALDDVTLEVAKGEIFFLLGPSGCGKSTLLRIIAGLHEPTSGRVYFNDEDVTSLPTEKRNAVMCFQSYALWPHMTVEQNVRFGIELRGLSPAEQNQRVNQVLRLVQMEALRDRKPNQLSGGQQQRVALARALVVHPRCLLLDEPLSNLDTKLRLEMRSEIRRICRQAQLTAIYVTHDQKEALSIADRMAILNAGRIEQVGRPQELYLRPRNRFVAGFMGETNFVDGTVVHSEDGRATVQTSLGRIVSAAGSTTQVHPGLEVTLSIRPEVVHLGQAPAQAVNRYAGIVHDTIYLGELAQHQVNIAADGQVVGPPLKALELNPRLVARDEAVERAEVWFDPADVVLLTE